LPVINVWEALNDLQELKLSQFIESIEYISLETTDSSVLYMPIVEVMEQFIVVRNSGQSIFGPILLFDRKTGKFLRWIGKSGRGPEEFQFGNSTLYNIYSKVLYGRGYNHDIKEYDLHGKFLSSFKLPTTIDENVPKEFGTPSVNLDQYLDSNVFVASIDNTIGWEKRRFVLFTRDSIVKIFPNHLFWKRQEWKTFISFGKSCFFRFNNQLNVKEVFNDTIFNITKSSLIPRFIFQTNGHSLPIEFLGQDHIRFDEIAKYLRISDICESTKYLFFQLAYNNDHYTGIFDKMTEKTVLCKLQGTDKSAFIDDINNFMPIRPKIIAKDNEMVFILDASEISRWINENPGAIEKLHYNMAWLNKISMNSNPTIVIAKIKN
jgi:hypothetical protein